MKIETPELKLQFIRTSGECQEFGSLFVTDKETGKEITRHGVLLVPPQQMLNKAAILVRRSKT
jgi:hypothetical protein